MHVTVSACFLIRFALQCRCRCRKRKEKLADFLIQALKQGALGILATVLQVLTSAKKQKQILKEGFKAFSWVF